MKGEIEGCYQISDRGLVPNFSSFVINNGSWHRISGHRLSYLVIEEWDNPAILLARDRSPDVTAQGQTSHHAIMAIRQWPDVTSQGSDVMSGISDQLGVEKSVDDGINVIRWYKIWMKTSGWWRQHHKMDEDFWVQWGFHQGHAPLFMVRIDTDPKILDSDSSCSRGSLD